MKNLMEPTLVEKKGFYVVNIMSVKPKPNIAKNVVVFL